MPQLLTSRRSGAVLSDYCLHRRTACTQKTHARCIGTRTHDAGIPFQFNIAAPLTKLTPRTLTHITLFLIYNSVQNRMMRQN